VGGAAIRFNQPRLWINSGGLGAMGFRLPRPSARIRAAAQAGVRRGWRRRFQMSIPELATVAEHGLPIKIIVMNNGISA